MPRMLRMPGKDVLPPGPKRELVAEFYVHYGEAGRPPLPQIEALTGTESKPRKVSRETSGASSPGRPPANGQWSMPFCVLCASCRTGTPTGAAGRSRGISTMKTIQRPAVSICAGCGTTTSTASNRARRQQLRLPHRHKLPPAGAPQRRPRPVRLLEGGAVLRHLQQTIHGLLVSLPSPHRRQAATRTNHRSDSEFRKSPPAGEGPRCPEPAVRRLWAAGAVTCRGCGVRHRPGPRPGRRRRRPRPGRAR